MPGSLKDTLKTDILVLQIGNFRISYKGEILMKQERKYGFNRILEGDAKSLLVSVPTGSIDLIVTSPPYADKRKHSYGGIKADEYVAWFMPISFQLKRVLKPTGSFILNIKEGANGERETYVLDLIKALRAEQDWLWVEEYVWHKTTCMPGKWPNRFRDAWERCLHFTKQRKFKMYQSNVMVPIGAWANKRLANPSKNDGVRSISSTNSGLGRKVQNWQGRTKVYPDNVLVFSPSVKGNKHSAAFPKELPSWFIKLFTKKGDVVLDPFIGSGTTAVASIELERKYLGFESFRPYYELSLEKVAAAKN